MRSLAVRAYIVFFSSILYDYSLPPHPKPSITPTTWIHVLILSPLKSPLYDLRASGVVVHSSLMAGPQPTLVQERRYNLYLLTGSRSWRIHLLISGLLMSTASRFPTSSVSLTKQINKPDYILDYETTGNYLIWRPIWWIHSLCINVEFACKWVLAHSSHVLLSPPWWWIWRSMFQWRTVEPVKY